MKEKTTIIVALLVGLGVGYLVHGTQLSQQNSNMNDAMHTMTSGLHGKTGNDFDNTFVTEMIVHHQGAVAMAELALAHAGHQEIKDLAKAIISAQTSEIKMMQDWQTEWSK